MIEYIQLRNFRTHKESELEFCPGVNVIVGDSDSGKTNIMRAIYWLAFGRPSGDSMRRRGANADTEVTIETAEHQISRIRGNTNNQYIVNDEVFKGFGQTVPPPVSDILNVNELNFMRQMDLPFLFSKTAGEVAQYLNRLINLDIIDSSLSNIKRMHSQAAASASSYQMEIQRLTHTLESYSWTDDADTDITKLEKKEARVDRLKTTAAHLDTVLDDVHSHAEYVKQCAYVPGLVVQIQKLCSAFEHAQSNTTTYTALRSAVVAAQNAQAGLAKLPATKGAEKALQALEQRVVQCDTASTVRWRLHAAVTEARADADSLQTILAEYTRSVVLLNKAMPETCPLCGQEIE